jgi:UrcA family protein
MFALASAAALADQPLAPATRVAKVSLGGLDLSTTAGARVAYERIKTVAERLCFWRGRTIEDSIACETHLPAQ